MMLPKIIGLAGKKGCGKTTLANYLDDEFGYKRMAFADPMKEMLMHSLHMDRETLEKMKRSGDIVDLSNGVKERITKDVCDALGTDVSNDMERTVFSNGDVTMRSLLQTIGTDIIRAYNDRWFIERVIPLAKWALYKGIPVVIDDVRFKNEADAIYNAGGDTYYIERNGNDDESSHPSENSLSADMFAEDKIIMNDGQIGDMAKYLFKQPSHGKCARKPTNSFVGS